jgi:hypothetical protein
LKVLQGVDTTLDLSWEAVQQNPQMVRHEWIIRMMFTSKHQFNIPLKIAGALSLHLLLDGGQDAGVVQIESSLLVVLAVRVGLLSPAAKNEGTLR